MSLTHDVHLLRLRALKMFLRVYLALYFSFQRQTLHPLLSAFDLRLFAYMYTSNF